MSDDRAQIVLASKVATDLNRRQSIVLRIELSLARWYYDCRLRPTDSLNVEWAGFLNDWILLSW